MKYTRLTTRMAPSSLQDWLEEELESRGIDGVVYTRYILSLLQDDDNDSSDDVAIDSRVSNTSLEANPNYINCCMHQNKKCQSNKWVHRRYQQSSNVSSWDKNQSLKWCECAYDECTRLMNIDQKRSVVVECLKSASEQDFEIESLVDQLCAKLKEYKCNMGHNQLDSQHLDTRNVDGCSELISSPKEQAKRYYAAFPALNTVSVGEPETAVVEAPTDSKLRRISLENDISLLEHKTKWDGRKIIEFAKKKDGTQEATEEDLSLSHQTATAYRMDKSRNPIEDITNVYHESNTNTSGCRIPFSAGNLSNFSFKRANTENYFGYYENLVPNFFNLNRRDEDRCVYKENVELSDEWENEKLKVLVSKFDNNIASLWNDDKSTSYAKRSIWCFDDSASSPQSSTSPSPKLIVGETKWCETELNNGLFDDSANSWQPFGKQTVPTFPVLCPTNGAEINDWFSTEFENVFSKLNENKTSLTNHGGDSLFVEVPSRRSLQVDNSLDCTQQDTSYLMVPETKITEEESCESLLTSPKTHFQPIKQESFDEESEDGTTCEADAEVSRLVPCSSICPNNEVKCDSKSQTSVESDNRSLSTSLPELTLFMGPFIDSEIEDKQSIAESGHSSKYMVNSEHERQSDVTSSSNEENDYEELCTMLNEVLREEESKKLVVDSDSDMSNVKTIDWFEKDLPSTNVDNSLQWNRYWESYQQESPGNSASNGFFNVEGAIEGTSKNVFVADLSEGEHFVDSVEGFRVLDCKYEEKEEAPFDKKSPIWFDENEFSTIANENFDSNTEWSAGGEFEFTNSVADDCADPCQVFYSWNLEKEWQREESNESFVAAQHRKVVEDWNGRRPCSFFMEGNCRRSDCKFSHDLRSITCKFWEEGSCFKGVLCPFFHGYPSETQKAKGVSANPKFLIESEADFPSLSTGNSEANLSESGESIVSPGRSKGKRDKQESNVLYRMVKKKRRKAGHQSYNEKAV